MLNALKQINCPNCNGKLLIQTQKVNYKKSSYIKNYYYCTKCYNNDVEYVPLTKNKNTKLLIKNAHDLNKKIQTSDNCVIKIPELNLSITTPTTSVIKISELINQFIEAKTYREIKKGEKKITVLIEDPNEISTIIQ